MGGGLRFESKTSPTVSKFARTRPNREPLTCTGMYVKIGDAHAYRRPFFIALTNVLYIYSALYVSEDRHSTCHCESDDRPTTT